MYVKPDLTQGQLTQIIKSYTRSLPDRDGFISYMFNLPYKRLIVELTEKGAEIVTPELIEKVKSELEGIKN